MDSVLNNPQRLTCHKTQTNNPAGLKCKIIADLFSVTHTHTHIHTLSAANVLDLDIAVNKFEF